MFNYFGLKSKIAHLYPAPKYPLIIEPFCGSAAYSIRYHTKQVWINDYDPLITDIWQWLLQLTPPQIDALPDLKPGDDLRDFNLIRPVRKMLGFCINRGKSVGANIYSGWAAKNDDCKKLKPKLHRYCTLLKHWQLTNVDYSKLPDVEATWFVDPPYEHFVGNYRHWKMNYKELAQWCKSRKGQVIVCESGRAKWLPFKYLATITTRNKNDEMIWTQG